ncbi:hypothetical protein [Caulobacter sp. 17J65-9]|uniref:hypothetical protein n=1 Tax=Caulobacter sp. 17J65-9 TaxID=2709382 RepID=UPI0013C863F0|nr:hypothetical protein [Caulobacter sp. 17J65-9]NEX91923.1 hypothetical protein [Caulobacter sp. 17J65-9]
MNSLRRAQPYRPTYSGDIVMTPLKAPAPTPTKPAPTLRSADFRNAIVKAQADGLGVNALTLRLTLRDESELKRDPTVKVEEISFKGGVMRFLGVKVVSGGVAVSSLDRGEA